jgi:hypothetical protein
MATPPTTSIADALTLAPPTTLAALLLVESTEIAQPLTATVTPLLAEKALGAEGSST